MLKFSGIWVPLVTPFDHDQVDLPALRRLVAHLADQGVAGFVACGSTGEAAMLDEAEQAAVLQATLDAAADKPVLMGLSGVRPERVAARARQLAEAHALAGYLLSPPAYVRPSQAGLLSWYRAVADASPVPIVAYDVPSRTGVRIQADTLLAMAEHPRIVALKDCSGDADAALRLLADGRLALLAGNDDEIFSQLTAGAVGAIAASAHLRPDLFVRLHRLIVQQQLQAAQSLWRALKPLCEALFAEPNPMPVKTVLARQGWCQPVFRAPMHAAGEATLARVFTLLEQLAHEWPAERAGSAQAVAS